MFKNVFIAIYIALCIGVLLVVRLLFGIEGMLVVNIALLVLILSKLSQIENRLK